MQNRTKKNRNLETKKKKVKMTRIHFEEERRSCGKECVGPIGFENGREEQ